MAKEIVTWCDGCMAEDQHSPGTTVVIGLDGKQLGIDLCTMHQDQLVKPLQALLDEFGSPVEVPLPRQTKKTGKLSASPSGPQHEQTVLHLQQGGVRKGKPPSGGRSNECLWCPLTYSGDGGGFGRHLRVAHGFSGLTEAFGGMCPVCGEGHFEMISAHVKRAHKDMGFESTTAPFTWARDNGDPHGVYAAKLQQVGSLDPKEEWEKTRERERVTNKENQRKGKGNDDDDGRDPELAMS